MQFQFLLQELMHGFRMIEALLEGISPEESRIKPDEESWSILEVICHLVDEEREDFRTHLDFILHPQDSAGWHLIDPQAWVSERRYNLRDFFETCEEFSSERTHSLEWLQGLAEADWSIAYHSQYGELSAGDMLSSWVAHDNLHIRQLVELRRQRIKRLTIPYKIEYAGDW